MKLLTLHNSPSLTIYSTNTVEKTERPLVGTIKAGFPSPADDFIELSIDLNKELIRNKDATYFGRVSGNSMINAGIADGDLVVIDKSITPTDGKIAVCNIDGEFTIKRIKIDKDCIWLVAENENFKPIQVSGDSTLQIWGIVTGVIKKFV
jgi:DNA polymerase V